MAFVACMSIIVFWSEASRTLDTMEATDELENEAMLALISESKLAWAKLREQLDEAESPSELLRRRLGAQLLDDDFDAATARARVFMRDLAVDGIGTHTYASSTYPGQLRTVHDYPPVIFTRGNIDEGDARSVAVVGTRNPSKQAVHFVRELVRLLAEERLPVVSGLARGVDTVAIETSLELGNRTIGVIGTGLNHAYPPENSALQTRVAEHLLISQFFPNTRPDKKHFPMRNRVMSAFTSATVIAEAGEMSGTRIQARAATQHGRPLVLSRAVYNSTEWAKQLVRDQLDVTVVGSPAEALEAVLASHRRPETSARTLTGVLA